MHWYWVVAISLAWLAFGFAWACMGVSAGQREAIPTSTVDSQVYIGLVAFCAVWMIAVTEFGLINSRDISWYVWLIIMIGALGQVWSVPKLAARVCRYWHKSGKSEYVLVPFLLVLWPLNWLVEHSI